MPGTSRSATLGARYWLIKSEPAAYSWDDLVRDGETLWDGVRNHRARNNLQAMVPGEQALFYHSVTEKAVVGIAEVSEAASPDPKAPDGPWVAVKVRPVRPLGRPVTLEQVKAEPALAQTELIRLSRLSVAEVTPEEWDVFLAMAQA
jgi:predicted RNA-binding protein with PUA-like domain